MPQRDPADQQVGNEKEQKSFGRAPDQGDDDEGGGLPQTTRSTISFLISAIALAGFRPLGQTWAQFMIVWQR